MIDQTRIFTSPITAGDAALGTVENAVSVTATVGDQPPVLTFMAVQIEDETVTSTALASCAITLTPDPTPTPTETPKPKPSDPVATPITQLPDTGQGSGDRGITSASLMLMLALVFAALALASGAVNNRRDP